MRFISIKAKNYRQHRALDFIFPRVRANGNDLNVILGSNTFGKTNFANAICWCLWGEEPDMALEDKNEGKSKLDDAVRKESIANGVGKVQVSVAIKIAIGDNDNETLYVMRRCDCTVNEKKVLEHPAEVTALYQRRDGSTQTMNGEEAGEFINIYLPQDIRSYIIFDGEQLTGFFKSERAQMVKTAMLALSGVNKLNKAIEHHRKRLEALDRQAVGSSTEISECEQKLANAENVVRELESKIEIETKNISDLDVLIAADEEFMGRHKDVPELQRRKHELEVKLSEVSRSLYENEQDKYELIREFYPLLKLAPHAIRVKNFIDKKRENKELPPPLRKEVFEEILKLGRCTVCGSKMSAETEREIRRQLALYSDNVVSPETSEVMMNLFEPQILAIIAAIKPYQKSRDMVFRRALELKKNERELQNEIGEVDEKLSMVDDTAKYQEAYARLKLSKESRDNSRAVLLVSKKELPNKQEEARLAKEAYERAYKKNVRDEGLRKMHEILEASNELIKKTKDRIIEKIRASIEDKANDYYKGLKCETAAQIGKILFDSNFGVSLREDGIVAHGTMSAAERALVALSVTLALHSEAGMNFPLIIDTPVANMDSGHRRNFAMTLKKLSEEKQLTLLFTDTEYVNDIPQVFSGCENVTKTFSKTDGVTIVK